MKDATLGWIIISACLVGAYKLGKEIGIAQGKHEAYNQCYNLASEALDKATERYEKVKEES